MSLNRRQFLKLAGLGASGILLAPKDAKASEETDPENAIAMLYDTTLCIGCRACQTACKDWNGNPPEVDESGLYDAPMELSADTWTIIQLYREGDEYSFSRLGCMHCVEPACASACPVHALEKTADGPVVYDPKRCIGCRYCMVACPFNVPRFEWDKVLPEVKKCTFCTTEGRNRLEQDLGPACADRCPTGALIWGMRGELLEEARQRLEENPDKYVDHIYGEDDIGGTSVMLLSDVDFEKVGYPMLGDAPVPKLSETLANIILPTALIGGAAVLTGLGYLGHRVEKEE
jgi:formate dehydrogenase beta subunit